MGTHSQHSQHPLLSHENEINEKKSTKIKLKTRCKVEQKFTNWSVYREKCHGKQEHNQINY